MHKRTAALAVLVALVTALSAPVFGQAAAPALGILLALFGAWLIGRRFERLLDVFARAVAALGEGRAAAALPRRGAGAAGRLAGALADADQALLEERRRAREERERLPAVLGGMAEGVLVLDAEGRALLANRRLRQFFNAWGEVAGRSALEICRRADVDEALAHAAKSFERALLEFEAPTPGGASRVLSMHAERFPQQGALLGVVAVFRDMTEIRRLEDMRRDFIGNVSHELRTPLTAIRGFAETLLQGAGSEEQRRQQLGVILRHSERLSQLIDDLLELTRLEGRRDVLEIAPVELGALCRGVMGDLARRISAERMRCVLDAPTPVFARASHGALEQVLWNLLDNALKYSSGGGGIAVRVHASGGRACLDVEDEGIGIAPDDLAQVFERFYRTGQARTREPGGVGLGLAIVKQLVRVMQGEVFAFSEGGKGARFSVRLPQAEGPAGQAAPAAADAETPADADSAADAAADADAPADRGGGR